MDKLKKLNLKKQLLSLQFCYEELIIENKALTSKANYLETLFRQTKFYTKKKNISNNIKFDFNFKNDKEYKALSYRKEYLIRNIDKQNNTLRKSILFNKYNEFMEEKESLIQTLEEKKYNLKSIQDELNLYKKNTPYNNFKMFKKLKSKIYLNETLDIPLIYKNINENKNNNQNISIIKPKFKKGIINEKIRMEKDIENSKKYLKSLYDYKFLCIRRTIKELGFYSILKNNKNNKTYIISVEPNQLNNINSSDSDSDSENNDNISTSNSINERLFFNNYKLNEIIYNKKNNIIKKIKKSNSRCTYKNEIMRYKEINFLNKTTNSGNFNNLIKNDNINSDIYANNSSFISKKNINIQTEINNERTGELNSKLLKIKEIYYNCLDKRYQLKSSLKENISKIYKTRERIKKIKKQRKIK